MRVSSDLQAPVKFRWINPQGKLVWSGSSRTINGTFDADAFGAAMVDALNDVKVPLFLEFEGAGGKVAKFCLRFT